MRALLRAPDFQQQWPAWEGLHLARGGKGGKTPISPVDPQSHAAALGVASFAIHLKFPGLVPTPTMEFRSTGWRDLGAVEWPVTQRNQPLRRIAHGSLEGSVDVEKMKIPYNIDRLYWRSERCYAPIARV